MKAFSPVPWKNLSGPKKVGSIVAAVVQFTLLGLALWDLRHRRPEEIKGPKRMWQALVFINYIGPLSYFLVGRKN
jgi:hypothetical protein